ncbi:unnamed protein product [marine sediment metagenome]|uniref:Uncharacterized protein n=1 Tax=marine sediment metagenome TaxID=412755 RepID=X0RXG3_9ZZZZ
MDSILKTEIHQYQYILSRESEAAEWSALNRRLLDEGRECPSMWSGAIAGPGRTKPETGPVELETAHLFSDQWNTACGHRVFDWYLDAHPNISKSCKRGHWLEITPAMREARRNTLVCGYCGHYQQAPAGWGCDSDGNPRSDLEHVFCPDCAGSEYLDEKSLHLRRLLPVEKRFPKRAPLTDAERAYLLPIYQHAQIRGNTERDRKRLAKCRADIIEHARRDVANAETERDGMIWLMDHGIRTGNVIFYDHKGAFCFGWRKPLGDAEFSELTESMGAEFPFEYEIKRA